MYIEKFRQTKNKNSFILVKCIKCSILNKIFLVHLVKF